MTTKTVRAYVDDDGDLMIDCYPFGNYRARKATPAERADSLDAAPEGWIRATVSTRTLARIRTTTGAVPCSAGPGAEHHNTNGPYNVSAERVDADWIAKHVIAGADHTDGPRGWRHAGYATPESAARVLIGDGVDPVTRDLAVPLIVAGFGWITD
jgi:hypothetical protein